MRRFDNCLNGGEASQAKWARRIPLRNENKGNAVNSGQSIAYVDDYKKFFYGSDWPLAPMASYRRLIESLIPKQHHQDVLGNNAQRVFKIS